MAIYCLEKHLIATELNLDSSEPDVSHSYLPFPVDCDGEKEIGGRLLSAGDFFLFPPDKDFFTWLDLINRCSNKNIFIKFFKVENLRARRQLGGDSDLLFTFG